MSALSLDKLSKEPAGYARDLFLQRFMEQDVSPEEALKAYLLTSRPTALHNRLLLYKSGSKSIKRLFDCMDTNIARALTKSADCARLGVNYNKISQLLLKGEPAVSDFAALVANSDKEKSKNIKDLIKIASGDVETVKKRLDLYFEVSKEFRNKFFNIRLSTDELQNNISQKSLERLIRWALFNDDNIKLQQSIANLDEESVKDSNGLFFLGLTKIKHSKNATIAFKKSALLATKQIDKDRGLFWLFLHTNDEDALRQVAKSNNLNFYSLVAKEKMGQTPTNVEYVGLSPTISDEQNLSSPFYWQKFKRRISKASNDELREILSQTSKLKKGEAYYLHAKQRLDGYKKELFLIPFKEAFADMNASFKTLLHATARQESNFAQGTVSSAYAIGVMQIIPLLAKELAAKRNEKIDFFELFEPAKNISYVATHFEWLEKRLSHPTLIAVAYNGGYGFLSSLLKKGLFDFKDSAAKRYEPFWSIENIPYEETREYAKKVSLNYALYSKVFGNETTLNELLERLKTLHRIDPSKPK